jgi:hypothetical protein
MMNCRRDRKYGVCGSFFLWIGILSLSVNTHVLSAQHIELRDSLIGIFKNTPKLNAKFDSWNGFITGKPVTTYSIKAGWVYADRFSVGLGYHFIRTGIRDIAFNDGVEIISRIRARYFAPYVEYVFYKRRNWSYTVPILLGIGYSFVLNDGVKLDRNLIISYEPALAFEYRVKNLFAVGAGYGYRIMLKNNKAIDQQFTYPLYVLRFRLILEGWRRRE